MSGAKNCPETPRQKMIAMMYLVLTAMLALNVSADILKRFTLVNNGLITSIQSTDDRNKYLMKSFEECAGRRAAAVDLDDAGFGFHGISSSSGWTATSRRQPAHRSVPW